MIPSTPSLRSIAEMMDEFLAYEDQTVVVKIGGNSMAADEGFLPSLARQLEFLQSRRVRLVVVHGGGPQLDQALHARQVTFTKGADGRRLTSAVAMEAVAEVMATLTRQVAESCTAAGCRVRVPAEEGTVFLHAKPLDPRLAAFTPEDRTGTPSGVDANKLQAFLTTGAIVIMSSLGRGADGLLCNINADDSAMALAVALKARRLILATNVAGVYGADGAPLSRLTPTSAHHLVAEGVIKGGMVPKVESALAALAAGVGGVAIVDAHQDWALLGELLTRQGFGTLITEG